MSAYDYLEPETVEEAVALLAEHGDDAHLIAGGASLVPMLRQGLLAPSLLVGLRRIEALRGIAVTDDGWLRIGAATTHRAIERSPDVARHAPALATAVGRVGTVRIRNQGTIGGNLAHADPAQDPPPMLMALDGVVDIAGAAGSRSVPVADLFVDVFETVVEPDEVITAVRVPPRAPGSVATYVKFLPGSADDYATVAVAVAARVIDGAWHDVRIACGAAGPVPLRVSAAEARLEGRVPDAATLDAAAAAVGEAVDPIDDVRGSADYKREMAVVWSRRAIASLTGGAAA